MYFVRDTVTINHAILIDFAGSNNGCGTSPALYLQEDPICGVQLLNQSELRAPTAEKAAFYLDAAIAARLNKDRKGKLKGNIVVL